MAVLYVTSNLPCAGRTALCCSLAATIAQQGHSVALFKPLTLDEPGVQDLDASFYKQISGVLSETSAEWPKHIAADQKLGKRDLDSIRRIVNDLDGRVSSVIVDGLPEMGNDGDVIVASGALVDVLGTNAISIVRYSDGFLDERAATLVNRMSERGLAGLVINQVTRHKGHEVATKLVPAMTEAGLRVIGTIPEDRRLLSATVRQVAEHIGGRFVLGGGGGDGAQLVEHLIIGGPVLEPGTNYFGRYQNKAVIVRGNRPDIQMAALATHTSCLILTGGFDPSQYVHHEAKETDVPIIVVSDDTHRVAAKLETLQQCIAFHHPAKIERFQKLLGAHVDLEILCALSMG